jgi:Xaa-Pro aminopeptidase
VPTPSQEDRVWSGDGVAAEQLAADSGFERITPISNLSTWFEGRRGRPLAVLGNRDITGRAEAYGLPRWGTLEVAADEALEARLSTVLSRLRRAKDAGELASMRAAVGASARGHLLAQRLAAAGMTERALQVELEAEFFRAGAPRTAYGSIVGTGPDGAVLPFSPSARRLAAGDLVLIDAAAEWDGYAADITRTFPVSATFSGAQRDLYSLVLAVQEAAIAKIRPGVEYRTLHLDAALQLASGLADLGLLRGSAQDLVDRDVHATFFPHGLGHMLGLSTHDVGGCLEGRTASDRFGLKWLRADLPLDVGYVVTVEPGVYFIPALLDDPERRSRFRDAVNWNAVDALRGFGGIRIEDDVLVTADGAEVLSGEIPKSIAEIEALRGAGLQR